MKSSLVRNMFFVLLLALVSQAPSAFGQKFTSDTRQDCGIFTPRPHPNGGWFCERDFTLVWPTIQKSVWRSQVRAYTKSSPIQVSVGPGSSMAHSGLYGGLGGNNMPFGIAGYVVSANGTAVLDILSSGKCANGNPPNSDCVRSDELLTGTLFGRIYAPTAQDLLGVRVDLIQSHVGPDGVNDTQLISPAVWGDQSSKTCSASISEKPSQRGEGPMMSVAVTNISSLPQSVRVRIFGPNGQEIQSVATIIPALSAGTKDKDWSDDPSNFDHEVYAGGTAGVMLANLINVSMLPVDGMGIFNGTIELSSADNIGVGVFRWYGTAKAGVAMPLVCK